MHEKKYKEGTVFLCKVTSISKNFFEVLTSNKEKGVVYINDVSDYYVTNLNNLVNIGDIVYLTYKGQNNNDILLFSFKENRSLFLRTPFEFELDKINQKNDFQNLFDFTNKEIKKWKK